MDLTVLGSGTLVPNGLRGPAGYVVEDGESRLLIDGGSGTLRRLAEAGVDYRAIDDLFYTHVHPDHTGDLVPFLFAQQYTPGFARTRPVRLYGPRGFRTFIDRLAAVYGRWMHGAFDLQVAELATGDTDATEALVALGAEVGVLVADCSMPDDAKLDGHLTPRLVGAYAERAGARCVALSHLYPATAAVDVAAACAGAYSGRIVVAHDLMRFRLDGAGLEVKQLAPCVAPLRWDGIVAEGGR